MHFLWLSLGAAKKRRKKQRKKLPHFNDVLTEWVFYDRAVFQFQQNPKQYYANVCALHFQCKKNTKTIFSWSRITSTTNFGIKYTSLSDMSEVRTIKSKSCFVYIKRCSTYVMNEWMNKHIKRTQNLVLKGFIQISFGLSLKAKSASWNCPRKQSWQFKMSRRLNLSSFYKHFLKANENVKKKAITN